MKKFYLLLAALLVAGVANANLTFWIGDKQIEPNTTITFSEIEKEVTGDGIEVIMAPELYISSDIYTKNLWVSATCTSGQKIQMCAGGSCEAGTTVKKNSLKVNADFKQPLEFEYINTHASEADIPTNISVMFEAQDGTKTNTNIAYTLVMNPSNSSLTLVETTKPVRYTTAGLEYNLDGHANIALYDITGRQVLNVSAEGQGTVNTHTLHTGIYIYSVRTASGDKLTGKIYVK